MERHRVLRRIAHSLYILPGLKSAARVLVRFTVQYLHLSLKNKQRLYNFFAKDTTPTQAVTCHIQIPHGKSLKVQLNLQDDLSMMWYYWGYAGYEIGTTRLICKLLRSKRVVFDVGANIGYYALLAASLIENYGELYAFEPWPEVFQQLLQNGKLNKFSSLYLNQMALSDQDGQECLFLPSDMAWTNASLIEGFTYQKEKIFIETIRFDTYCLKNSVSVVDLIKIDVEGAELKVLRGMGALLDVWLPDIICEVLQPFENDLNNFFLNKPYRKFLIRDNGLDEVDRIRAHSQYRDYYLSCAPVSLEGR